MLPPVSLVGTSARCIFISAEPHWQGTTTGVTTGHPQTDQESLKQEESLLHKMFQLTPGERNSPIALLNSTRGFGPPSGSSSRRLSKQARLLILFQVSNKHPRSSITQGSTSDNKLRCQNGQPTTGCFCFHISFEPVSLDYWCCVSCRKCFLCASVAFFQNFYSMIILQDKNR